MLSAQGAVSVLRRPLLKSEKWRTHRRNIENRRRDLNRHIVIENKQEFRTLGLGNEVLVYLTSKLTRRIPSESCNGYPLNATISNKKDLAIWKRTASSNEWSGCDRSVHNRWCQNGNPR